MKIEITPWGDVMPGDVSPGI
ncbi:unnamed protein product, partial [Rotaria magnacalcarata]